jgi:hypothetical protein
MQGKRYLDLFRDGALLGHRAAGTLTVMKSALSQGLASGLPSAWEARLVSALSRQFPSHSSVRLFSSADRALEAAARWLGTTVGRQAVHDPALAPTPADAPPVAFWRPFLPVTPGARVLLPVLPFSVCGAPAPVCFAGELPPGFPRSDALPGFILAGALHALAATVDPRPPASLGDCPLLACPAAERAIDGASGWARTGPYVRAVMPAADYPRVHAEFLRSGVLLSPGHPGPSVLPGECSPGEAKLLADLFAGIPGGCG